MVFYYTKKPSEKGVRLLLLHVVSTNRCLSFYIKVESLK